MWYTTSPVDQTTPNQWNIYTNGTRDTVSKNVRPSRMVNQWWTTGIHTVNNIETSDSINHQGIRCIHSVDINREFGDIEILSRGECIEQGVSRESVLAERWVRVRRIRGNDCRSSQRQPSYPQVRRDRLIWVTATSSQRPNFLEVTTCLNNRSILIDRRDDRDTFIPLSYDTRSNRNETHSVTWDFGWGEGRSRVSWRKGGSMKIFES